MIFTKENNVFRRITAFIMALIMGFTLVPWSSNVIFAADGDYVFTTVSAEDGSGIIGASISIYAAGADINAETPIVTGTTDDTGSLTVAITDYPDVQAGCTYIISANGFYGTSGVLESETNVSVPMQAIRGMSGLVLLADQITPAIGVPVYLFKDGAKVSEAITDVNGQFLFNVVEDASYMIVAQASEFKQSSCSIVLDNFVATPGQYSNVGNIVLLEKEDVVLSVTESVVNLVLEDAGDNVVSLNPALTEGYVLKYESSDTGIVEVDLSGNLIAKGVGVATITVSLESDEYKAIPITYTVNVGKKAQDNFNWAYNFEGNTNSVSIEYGATLPSVLATGECDGATVTYASNNEAVATVDVSTGEVTVHKVGTATITATATVPADGDYETKSISYEIVVGKKAQNEFVWNYTFGNTQKVTLTYGDTAPTVLATGECGEATVKYTSGNTAIATVDETTGAVTIHKAGEVVITATAEVPDSGNYESKSITYTILVNKAPQNEFEWDYTFGSSNKITVVYGETVPSVVVEGACVEATVSYASNNENVATVDAATGVVEVHKAGEAVITATALVADDGNYESKSISYTIVVKKASQTISFDRASYSVINGGDFTSPVITSQSVSEATGAITYSVEANNGIATINRNTGELTFTLKPGTITVTATKAADERYASATASYTISVKAWDPLNTNGTSTYFSITGTKEDASSDWYTKTGDRYPIQLVAKNGYVLYSGSTIPDVNTRWNTSVTVENVSDGTNNSIEYYIKEEATGYISKLYVVNNIKVDTVAPSAEISIDEVTLWEKVLSFFTFNLAGQDTPELKITTADETSKVKAVYYYIAEGLDVLKNNGKLDVNALEREAVWKSYKNVVDLMDNDCDENVIYAKVIDKAGNTTYVSTNGLIFDGAKPVLTPTVITRDINGYYNGNVEIELDVFDAKPYSGIKEITYVVENAGVVTDEGTLFTFKPSAAENPKKNELVNSWNSSKQKKNVVVKAVDNNSDNVKVTFTAIDNAGNKTESVVNLKIDITAPVISVSYDNNLGDASFGDSVYFNTSRVATITVQERHFDANRVKIDIANTDGVIPTVSEWQLVSKGTGNLDDKTYAATITYVADGDYTFNVSCTDELENASGSVNYGNSQAPSAFTIDKTAPVISISYDNNDVLNENYYKADRTATITIQEHNFNASRVNVLITATDDGQTIASPVISGWTSSGNTHTAYINYSADALYVFDIEYLDKAGNSIADVAPQSFYVDKTMPQVSITEISDQSANNEDKIGFVITATDTNFDVFTPVLSAVVKTENGFSTTELNVASISEITNGQIYTVDNLDADGIYSIKCTVIDKAGNAYTEVSLQREDGSTYVESRAGEDTLLTFSVNRAGSTFDVNEITRNITTQYYVQRVIEDLVIYEVNTNELVSQVVTLNGTELVEGTDYTVSSSGGNGEWMRYTYTINKELFETEGEYVIVISSTDGADNDAFSDIKNTNISFVVDRTAPIVTVTGMESGRTYQTDKQTVTVIPTDDGGIIELLIVRLVDRDGNVIKELFNMSGDELRELIEANGGKIDFEIEEGLNQNIQIICGDGSFDENGNSNTYSQIFEDVSVSASAIAIFFAGNTITYIIAGVAAIVLLGGGVFFIRKRKK